MQRININGAFSVFQGLKKCDEPLSYNLLIFLLLLYIIYSLHQYFLFDWLFIGTTNLPTYFHNLM